MITQLSRYLVYKMKFTIVFSVLFFVPAMSFSQVEPDSSMSFDLLLTPASPGFVLLGIEPAAVERPGTPTDLVISFLNRTENLSILPKDWAVEFAPYWLLAGENITYEDYAHSKNIKSTFLQTTSFSIATSSKSGPEPDSLTTSLALGTRFSILRGNIDPEFNNYAVRLDSLYDFLGILNDSITSKLNDSILKDSLIITLQTLFPKSDSITRIFIETLIAEKESQIKQEVELKIRSQHTHKLDSIEEIASQLQLRRIGWKLDVAGGSVIDFPQNIIDDATLNQWGAWLTCGYEWRNKSILGVLRYLASSYEPNKTSIDAGGRLIFDNLGKISLSAETVYRRFLENDLSDQWRIAFIIDYAVAKNKRISFSFGRDFSGDQSENLIASMNLLLGFGSNRPIRQN